MGLDGVTSWGALDTFRLPKVSLCPCLTFEFSRALRLVSFLRTQPIVALACLHPTYCLDHPVLERSQAGADVGPDSDVRR